MSMSNLMNGYPEKEKSIVGNYLKLGFVVLMVLLFTCNPAHSQQTKKDSIPTPTDTLTAQYRYSMTATVMGYFQQNFKELKISQFEDFQKWLDDIFGKYLASFIKDYEEKKKAIKTISITH